MGTAQPPHAQKPPGSRTPSRWWIAWSGGSLIAALAVDYSAPWPYVMTPLYAVPILVAAEYGTPQGVRLVAVLATAVNILSAVLQGTPPEIWVLYTIGLLLTAYLALRLAEQRRETANRAAEAELARDQLRQFTGMVAHDLRNPLTTLLMHTELLQRSFARLAPGDHERALDRIHSAGLRMKRLTSDLLDTSRLLTGHFQVDPRQTDLAAIVREAVTLRQTTSPDHPITLVAPERLEGEFDTDRVGQMVENLLSNAAKYSPPGADVRVTVEREGECALVRVADSGPGIAPEELAGLFRPFARLERDRHTEGTGLGLTITRAIAEAHGGTISVESQPGSGSTFTIVLPLMGQSQTPVLPESARHGATQEPGAEATGQ